MISYITQGGVISQCIRVAKHIAHDINTSRDVLHKGGVFGKFVIDVNDGFRVTFICELLFVGPDDGECLRYSWSRGCLDSWRLHGWSEQKLSRTRGTFCA